MSWFSIFVTRKLSLDQPRPFPCATKKLHAPWGEPNSNTWRGVSWLVVSNLEHIPTGTMATRNLAWKLTSWGKGRWNPMIYRGKGIHHRWLFWISEPSTGVKIEVSLKPLKAPVFFSNNCFKKKGLGIWQPFLDEIWKIDEVRMAWYFCVVKATPRNVFLFSFTSVGFPNTIWGAPEARTTYIAL